MNGLVRAFRGDTRYQTQYVNRLEKIVPMWESQWGAPKGFSDTEQPSHHELPYQLCVELKSLVDDHKQGRIRNEGTNELFFSTFLNYRDKDDIPNYYIDDWKGARETFLHYAHIQDQDISEEAQAKIKTSFQHLVRLLDKAATGNQYDRIRGFDEILEETNE